MKLLVLFSFFINVSIVQSSDIKLDDGCEVTINANGVRVTCYSTISCDEARVCAMQAYRDVC